MMGKNYHKKTNRSRRKVQDLKGHAVTAELADGKACFQMVLPTNEMLFDAAQAIEQTAGKAGLNDDEGRDRRRGYPPHMRNGLQPFARRFFETVASPPGNWWV